jgi:membrane-bound lytic murein transglycosylase B
MLNVLLRSLFGFALMVASVGVFAADYRHRVEVQEFAEDFAKRHGRKPAEIMDILQDGEQQQAILDAISRPAERVLTWGDYRTIFLEPKRIRKGVEFWNTHAAVIDAASRRYGVEPEIIVAIIGVETRYGTQTGKYRVLDALMTLGFDYEPRAPFFLGQLEEFLLMGGETDIDLMELTGSYAGAMGYGQFIPGSYRKFAVDHDGDGFADIWNNPADAIASVAHYFSRHGWQYGNLVVAPVLVLEPLDEGQRKLLSSQLEPEHAVRVFRKAGIGIPAEIRNSKKATLMELVTAEGTEYWLGFGNFYAITRYNHSHLYAMAVYQLGQLIKMERHIP